MKEEIRKLFPLEFYINDKEEMVSEISLKTLNKLSDEIIKLQQENENLQSQLKEKEELIKEAREYIEKCKHLNWYMESCYTNDLLEILSKGENK